MRSFASRRRRVSATTSFSAISGCSRIRRAHVHRGQGQQLGVLGGLDAGGAALAVEHRELAEDRARPEGRQRDRPAVGVLADHPAAAAAGRCSRRRRDRPRGRPGCRRESCAGSRPARPAPAPPARAPRRAAHRPRSSTIVLLLLRSPSRCDYAAGFSPSGSCGAPVGGPAASPCARERIGVPQRGQGLPARGRSLAAGARVSTPRASGAGSRIEDPSASSLVIERSEAVGRDRLRAAKQPSDLKMLPMPGHQPLAEQRLAQLDVGAIVPRMRSRPPPPARSRRPAGRGRAARAAGRGAAAPRAAIRSCCRRS